MPRLAFINTHPVQYYAPLHRAVAARPGWDVRVFFTWHGGGPAVDAGFKREFAWDIPLTEGYEFEVVPNTSREPGPHHRAGIANPELVARVAAWGPDAIVLTGYNYTSHHAALRQLPRMGFPVLLRGDSHLLDRNTDRLWWLKRRILGHLFRKCAAVLSVGLNNRDYFAACGVPRERIIRCPHSIDRARFAEQAAALEPQAAAWRRELGFDERQTVLLFAGKLEPKKRPVEMLEAIVAGADPRIAVLVVGNGELEGRVAEIASANPGRIKHVPFQNQSRMPVVYRVGDLFVLPSGFGETWGLAVNEALACGRPVLVSDRVGCAADVVNHGNNGWVFPADAWDAFLAIVKEAATERTILPAMRQRASDTAMDFDIPVSADTLLAAVERVINEQKANAA
jgi:glycosyltransferase involved in cell wall biosynthesis